MQHIPANSPVLQDFVWFGEYSDGGIISEFDFITKQENSFYSIQREKLIRFGLIGHGSRLYFEVPGGIFKVNDHVFEFAYTVGGTVYPLTGLLKAYRDIIAYKDAEASISNKGTSSSIFQYNVGYKEVVEYEGIRFNFKVICKIPLGSPAFMDFRLVANQDLNGKFLIARDRKIVADYDAPLSREVGGELSYVIRF